MIPQLDFDIIFNEVKLGEIIMKIKTFKIDEANILPESLVPILEEDKYCVVDIETTGLSSRYNRVILIGILYRLNNYTLVQQFFAENPKEEIQILNEFSNIFKNFTHVVTYNGISFDIPFLKDRFARNNLHWDFNNVKHIDILHHIRSDKNRLNLENLKLKTVEGFLGINRKDTISGKDSVLLYNEYVKNPSPSIEKTILLHNYEDVYYLNKLLNIFDHISVDKYDLTGRDVPINYNSKDITFTFYPKDTSIKKNTLYIKGQSNTFNDMFDFVHYDPSFQFNWYPTKGKFDFTMPLYEGYLSTNERCNYISLDSLNLSKSYFKESTYYNSKFFPNNLFILKYDNEFNLGLVGDLLKFIFQGIFQNN